MIQRGLNLYGHLSSSVGLGAAARNTAHALGALGIPFDTVNVVSMPPPRQQPMGADSTRLGGGRQAEIRINLFHTNPPEIRSLLNSPSIASIPLQRFNAAVPFWELSELPPSWVDCLDAMDAVLAPSLFLQRMVERTMSDMPVLHFPQGIHLPRDIRIDRGRWGMGADEVVFVCSFDLQSDMTRKNPLGVIAAFRRAFGEHDAARLIVRVNHAESANLKSDMEALKREAGGAVQLLLGPLSFDDVLSLYASADVYVSLHRAEGLGLGMLEAMALGKPVIATAYSGNMDFMDEDTAVLVGLPVGRPVKPSRAYDLSVVGENQQWAEPDIDQGSAAMRKLYRDAALRDRLGASARAKALEVNDAHSGGAVFEQLRAVAEQMPPSQRHKRARQALLAAGRREAVRRKVVAGLRTLRLKPPAPVDERSPIDPVVTGPNGLGSSG